MKAEELKLYNKYRNINYPNREFIYIGNYYKDYCFLFKYSNIKFSYLKNNGFDPDKIVKDLNLEVYFDKYGIKSIKGYSLNFYSKKSVEMYFKLDLKNKLKNIINR